VGITLSLLTIFGIQINLTIFAALLTVVGYSLNDTIVIFDRIRENIGLQKKVDFPLIAKRSLNQTLNRTLLTSVTTLFVIGSLVVVGGGVIEGFATTMLFGVLTGTYSSLFVATPFVAYLHRKDKNSNLEVEAESTTQIKADPMGTV
jgi:preprotein translocase SecF subunit